MLDGADLDEEFANGSSLNVVPIRFADSSEEVQWVGVGHVKADSVEHVSLRLDDLLDAVTAVGHVQEVGDRGADDLFVLCRDEQCRQANKLELDQRDHSSREESVNQVDGDEQGLGE